MSTIRRLWRRLISMRTALILLFLLALAAIPGSLLPQRPLNADKTSSYITAHGSWGTFLDKIGMFDVFGAPWFAAIYLLLAISLIGCLVPRIRVHARNVLAKPPAAPKKMEKLPEHATLVTSLAPDAYARAARQAIGRNWRIKERDEPGGVLTLSGEKGYLRETGNLIFHVCLVIALVLIAVGRLFSYESSYLVEQGAGFCNGSFADSSRPGRLAAQGHVTPPPFCVTINTFTAKYLADGQPSEFRADVSYQPSVHKDVKKSAVITVNHPLRLESDRVYLVGHGYSPQITVTMPNGTTYQRTADFVPTDPTTFFSEGAFEVTQPSGTNEVGVEGFFAPTPATASDGTISSSSPSVNNPVLGIFIYTGTLHPTGQPHSTSSLDKTKLTKLTTESDSNLHIGQSVSASNGVKVTFDGWVPWVTMQVSHDPAQTYLLAVAVLMVIGLIGSLGIRRRRVWLRITPGAASENGSANVNISVGGLARSDAGNFTAEFAGLLRRLDSAARPSREDSPDIETVNDAVQERN